MTQLAAAVAVPLPAHVVEESILEYFRSMRRESGEIVIPLRVSLRDFGIPAGLALERDVTVNVVRRRDATNINEETVVAWEPRDGGPYPRFSGRLVTWSEQRPDESFIELSGEYDPPGGAAGQIFDDAIGHLIAQRTAHELLETLSEAIRGMHRERTVS